MLRMALTPGPSPASGRGESAGPFSRLREKDRMRVSGFTLIELVVTLALVSLMAMVAVPLYEVTAVRMKEMELRTALRQIRTALDAYKDAADAGKVQKDASDSGYPPSLKVLVEGVDAVQTAANMAGSSSNASSNSASNSSSNFGTNSGNSNGPTRLMFLRQVPRDLRIRDHAVGHTLSQRLIPLDEQIERPLIARTRPRDQLGVCPLFHDHPSSRVLTLSSGENGGKSLNPLHPSRARTPTPTPTPTRGRARARARARAREPFE